MKKVVFVIRDGYDAEYILNHLVLGKAYSIDVIKETGTIARKKKLKRFFKGYKFFKRIWRCMDLAAILLYDYLMTRKMKQILGFKSGTYESVLCVDDINEKKCTEKIKDIGPDMVLIYGTGILQESTIKEIGADIYNIHSSVLPYYKNVHSDFWAFVNKDYDKIGISIFKLDAGIDTGAIAYQRINPLPAASALHQYKAANIKLIVEMIPKFIEMYIRGGISLTIQNQKIESKGITPGIKDLLKLFRKNK